MKFATTFAAMMIAGMLPLASASQPASQGLRQVVNRPRSRPWRCSLPGKRHDRCVADSKHRRLGHRHHHRNRQWQRDHRYEHVPGRRQPAVHKRICVRQHRGHFLRDRRGQSVNIFSFYGQMTPPTGQCLWRIRFSGRIWRRDIHADRGSRSVDLGADADRLGGAWHCWLSRLAEARRHPGLAFGKDAAGAVRLMLRFWRDGR
jgi:hypothetical protein